MKKIISLLVVIGCIVGCKVYAQIKVGNITLDSITAKKYFADCYLRPDTIKKRDFLDYGGCYNCTMRIEDADRAERQAKDFNENLERISIGVLYDTVRWDAYIDTLWEWSTLTALGSNDTQRHSEKYDSIYHVPSGMAIYQSNRYLVPRKPSEDDFVKWYAKLNNQ